MLVLRGGDGGAFVPIIAAIAAFLAALAILALLATRSITDRWHDALAVAMTVEIEPRDAPDARSAAALAILRETPGIARAEPIARERVAAMLAPWLGGEAAARDLPLPILIDVTPRQGAALDLAALQARLAAALPGVRVDDHRAWRDTIEHSARLANRFSLLALLSIAAAALAAIVFATRARIAIHREQIAILHLMGALDGSIAREFGRDAWWRAALGALGGGVMAIIAAKLLVTTIGDLERAALPVPQLDVWRWVLPLVAVPIMAAIAATTAWLAAFTTLRSDP
jgi:cell division transport system permease protein